MDPKDPVKKHLLHPSEVAGEHQGEEPRKHRSRNLTVYYVVISILCTFLNYYAYEQTHKPRLDRYSDFAYTALRRPDPWVGLDRVQPPKHDQPIMIYPNLISKVNKAYPGRAYSDDPVLLAELGGFTKPEDVHIQITNMFSTLVRFRTVDYKMEKCELAISVPPITVASNFTLGNGDNLVDVWRLETDTPLDPPEITWNTRPGRVAKLDTISFQPGTNHTYNLPCPRDTLHVFEFSGATGSTDLQWIQNHFGVFGIVMYQYPTFS